MTFDLLELRLSFLLLFLVEANDLDVILIIEVPRLNLILCFIIKPFLELLLPVGFHSRWYDN